MSINTAQLDQGNDKRQLCCPGGICDGSVHGNEAIMESHIEDVNTTWRFVLKVMGANYCRVMVVD